MLRYATNSFLSISVIYLYFIRIICFYLWYLWWWHLFRWFISLCLQEDSHCFSSGLLILVFFNYFSLVRWSTLIWYLSTLLIFIFIIPSAWSFAHDLYFNWTIILIDVYFTPFLFPFFIFLFSFHLYFFIILLIFLLRLTLTHSLCSFPLFYELFTIICL